MSLVRKLLTLWDCPIITEGVCPRTPTVSNILIRYFKWTIINKEGVKLRKSIVIHIIIFFNMA